MFNFNSLASVQTQTSSNPRLAPWGIYDVKFSGCRVEHIQGKNDPNVTYDILKIKFEGTEGMYEESVFFPKEQDNVRQVYENADGSKRETPSNFERTMALIGRIAGYLNPDGFKKMQEMSPKFKSFDDVCKVLIKITDPKIGTELKLKLVGRTDKDGNVRASLPKFLAINKDGETWLCDNIIGDKVFFSDYEKKKMEEYTKSKPTSMKEDDGLDIVEEQNVASNNKEEDIDLDSFLN